jgi:hypothetical protein
MIRTLKITSVVALVAAVAVAVFVGLYGLKGNPDVEAFLDGPGFISEFRKTAKATTAPKDQVSPLVREAKLFALRINPPPPPRPKTPVKPKTTSTKSVATKPSTSIPGPKVQHVNANFKVIATCRYDSTPERSLALLEMAAEGQKWYRQGEKVGHLTINEIKDGTIVMFKDGQFNSEVDAVIPAVVSLLKSEGNTKYIPPPSSPARALPTVSSRRPVAPRPSGRMPIATRSPAPRPSGRMPIATGSTISRPPVPAQRTYTRPSQPTIRAPIRRPTTVRPTQPTVQERKVAVDENIDRIQEIMAASGSSGSQSAGDAAEEQKIWNELLKTLQQERTNLDDEPTQK